MPLENPEKLTRRKALKWIIGTGGALVIACGKAVSESSGLNGGSDLDGGLDGGAPDAGDAGSGADAGSSCAVTPEGEVGPYFADDSDPAFNRSNILANLDGTSVQTGIPLTLSITLLDTENSCAPYVGAQVDIWHCNSLGVYSDISSENTSSEQWLRGYQVSDANGALVFQTIVPGWYAGRTTHIHLRVRSSYDEASATSDGTNTTQLFFAQTFVDTLDTTVTPYEAEGTNPTTNAGDRVYAQEENGANLLTLVGSNANGYSAAVTIYLPITTDDDTTTVGDTGDGGMGPGGTGPGGDGGMFPRGDGGFPGGDGGMFQGGGAPPDTDGGAPPVADGG